MSFLIYKLRMTYEEDPMDEPLLLASEVARKVRRSAQCIRSLADRRVLPCMKTEGGTRLFKLSDVLALEERLREQESTQEPAVA